MATKSLVASGRSYIDVFNYAQTIEKMHHEARRAIRGCYSKAAIVGATMAHGSKIEVFRVGTLSVNLISTRGSLVGPFR